MANLLLAGLGAREAGRDFVAGSMPSLLSVWPTATRLCTILEIPPDRSPYPGGGLLAVGSVPFIIHGCIKVSHNRRGEKIYKWYQRGEKVNI